MIKLSLLGKPDNWIVNSRAFGVPHDNGFPDSFFNIFFPGITSNSNDFWKRFYKSDFWNKAAFYVSQSLLLSVDNINLR